MSAIKKCLVVALFVFMSLFISFSHAQEDASVFPIVYVALIDEDTTNYEIMVMNSDGTDVQQLTNNASLNLFPDWSPDGSRVAFVSRVDNNLNLYTMAANGSELHLITDHADYELTPDWSPDGRYIAFYSNRDGNDNIYVIDIDGNMEIQLTDDPAADYAPVWSPDGTKMAFTSDRDTFVDIYLLDLTTGEVSRFTNSPGADFSANWSSDSQQLVYIENNPSNNNERTIVIADVNGTEVNRITVPDLADSPSWSPDGTEIIFDTGAQQGPRHLYAVEIATGTIRNLTDQQTQTINADTFIRIDPASVAPIDLSWAGGDAPVTVAQAATPVPVTPLPTVVAASNAPDDPVCTALVQTAYQITREACTGINRDQACYGNTMLEAQPDDLAFEATGDRVDLSALEGLRLSSMNTATGEWGISLMHISANLPEENTSQNVELVLFGNVQIQNAGGAGFAEPVFIPVTAADNVNVRSGPSTSDARIDRVDANTPVTADARTEAGDWLRLILSEEGASPVEYGWASAQFFTAVGGEDFNTLPVIDPANTTPVAAYGPMQAFYFTSEANDRPCQEAPDSGILIQTPEGVGEITLLVNEVVVDLGSTLYFQAQPNQFMTIYILEGRATVTSQGAFVTAPAGTRVRVPLDANGVASGIPIGPESYGGTNLLPLPVPLVSQAITIAPSVTEEQALALQGAPRAGIWQIVAWDSADPTPCQADSQFRNRTYPGWTMEFVVDENGVVSWRVSGDDQGNTYDASVSPFDALVQQSPNTYVEEPETDRSNIFTFQFLRQDFLRFDAVFRDACPGTNGFTAQWVGPIE